MHSIRRHSRRTFLKTGSTALGLAATTNLHLPFLHAATTTAEPLLTTLPYGDVRLASEPHERQLRETHTLLMSLDEDSMLQPLRAMAGMPTPGASLGGWYTYNPDYDPKKGNPGFAPAHSFGQWVSGLARYYAITGDTATRDRVLRLTGLYRQTISAGCYTKTRFPAYNYDKYVCMLMDAHSFAHDPNAWAILDQTTDTALPHLPTHAIPHGVSWRPGTDDSYTWDESYTMPENLFLVAQRGAGSRYHQMASRYLEDKDYFEPLSRGVDSMAGQHAYSHVNALCSAMQAGMAGSAMHMAAGKHGFDLLDAQSFATGGWGPDEQLRHPASDDLYTSLTKSHSSFETPCGSYAHTKLTRYLLSVTRDGRYGDSMERVIWNTVLGAKPLEHDGHTFYYSDYNNDGHRRYHPDAFPCCSGTLPQVVADYRINSYLRDANGLYVVLYMPSSARWDQDGVNATLSQTHTYPLDGELRMLVTVSRPKEFAIRLRIPAWSRRAATISVNGKPVNVQTDRGFATLRRRWESGDRIDLHLPMENRLEAINAHHPDTVALVRGPLVLFLTGQQQPVTRKELLSARRSNAQTWQVSTAKSTIDFVPFTGIGDREYATYVTTT